MRKRIAFVINSMSAGGAERVIASLSNGLTASYDIFIISLDKQPSFYSLLSNVELLYCSDGLKPSRGIKDALLNNFKLYKAITGHLKKNKIDICIGFMTENNILSILASKRCRIPVIISERNNPYKEVDVTNKVWKGLRRLIYPYTNVLVVQTKLIKSFYEDFLPIDKIEIIPNPINPEFKPRNTQEKQNIILNVGRLSAQKNQKMLIQAFSRCKTDDWKLNIVGEGVLRDDLELLISDLELKDKVHLLGTQTNIQDYYEKAKIFAFSSNYEGFPNALMEAMYFGLPSISTACPSGPDELIRDGKNGFLVPVGDVDLMAEKLQTLIDNSILRGSFQIESTKTMQPYKLKFILKSWEAIINNLLHSNKN